MSRWARPAGQPAPAGLGSYRWLTASMARRWGFLVLFTIVTRLPISDLSQGLRRRAGLRRGRGRDVARRAA